MTIPEIRAALNELHERACKSEALLEKAQADMDELRAQLGVERYPAPPQPYDLDKPNGTLTAGGTLAGAMRSTRY